MRFLFLGDPHCTVSNKTESEKLMSLVAEYAHPDITLVILGDLTHTHANIRVEVLEFWNQWLSKLNSLFGRVIVLVGNHDQTGDYKSNSHSLSVFKNMYENVSIVDGNLLDGIFGYMPYIHDKKLFTERANELCSVGAKVIVAHAELDGAKYESGMPVIDGVKYQDINASLIISGHYHSRQRFGNVIYPGTARWLTSADKNEPKGLWLVVFDDNGLILNEQYLDTSHVCTPIYAYQYKEGEAEPVIPEGSRASVELVGSSEWVCKQKARFKGKASVSSKITDKSRPENRKTGHNLAHFVNNVFEVSTGLHKDKMIDFMRELGVL
jgi:calcineurin-like phosphoesterase family protein